MHGTVVGVLRGGSSKEHEVSLKTGHAMLTHLPKDRFTARDIFIDRSGVWHMQGCPTTPTRALHSLDVVMIGLHSEYGEDGQVQRILEQHGVPYTGSKSFPSYLAMHKLMSKQHALEHSVLTPHYRYIEPGADVEAVVADIVRHFSQPVVVKAVCWGSSGGALKVSGYTELLQAIMEILEEAQGVLVEEYIQGREATVGVVEGFRGEDIYALPSIEIVPSNGDSLKYPGTIKEVCPGNFSKSEKDELARLSRLMHQALGLRHYSHSDFIVSPKGIYYLETNSLPRMTTESSFTKSLTAVGVKFPDFLAHVVEVAHKR